MNLQLPAEIAIDNCVPPFTPSAEEIARNYSTAFDSVNLISALLEKPTKSSGEIAALQTNASHLAQLIEKDCWTTEDLSALIGAAQQAFNWLALGEHPVEAPPTPIVNVVSPRQIRQALTAVGLRAQVEAAVAEGSQDLRDWWEFSTAFEQNHPLVEGMAAQLGIPGADLSALFELAKSL